MRGIEDSSMYLSALVVHNFLRWVVLALALYAIVRAAAGLVGRRAWQPPDDAAGRWFTISMDVQLVIGLLLYGVLSPITRNAFADMGAAMKEAASRFWAVEHLVMMLVAVGFTHVGRARSRRAATDAGRHRAALIFFGLALVAVLAGIPWPGMADGRPLVRFW